MNRPKISKLRAHAAAIYLLFALFAISIAVRVDTLGPRWSFAPYGDLRAWNNEAAADFLRYEISFKRVPFNADWLLPVYPPDDLEASLGHGLIPERDPLSLVPSLGADTMVDREGHLAYLSFPPGSFVIVHALFLLAGTGPTPAALQTLNLAIQCLCAVLLFEIARKVFVRDTDPPLRSAAICVAAASTYIFATGSMHDHVATFWAHHVSQPIMLLGLLVFCMSRYFKTRAVILAALVFLGAVTEWSAHLFNAAIFGTCLYQAWQARHGQWRRHAATAAAVAVAEAAALASLACLYAHAFGIWTFVHLLSARAAHQAGSEVGFHPFYYLFFLGLYCGPFLLLLGFWTAMAEHVQKRTAETFVDGRLGSAVLVIAFAPCLENLALNHHAVLYAFAELKVVSLLSLLLACVFVRMIRLRPSAFYGIIGSTASAAILSVVFYYAIYGDRIDLNSGKLSSQTICMRDGRAAATEINADIRPGQLLLTTPEHNLEFYVVHVPVIASTVGEARRNLAMSHNSVGRFFVIGGVGFDGRLDLLGDGLVSADIEITKDSPFMTVSLLPIRYRSGPARQSILSFYNRWVVGLVPPGTLLRTTDGGRIIVRSSNRDTGDVTVDAPANVSLDGKLSGRVLVTPEIADLPLAMSLSGEPSDWYGCSNAERTKSASVFPWNR
jgi:hypothetical protein